MDPSERRAVVILWPLLTLDSWILPSTPGFQKGYYNRAKVTRGSSYPQVSQLPVFLLVILWGWSLQMNSYGKPKTLYSRDHEQQSKPPIIWVFLMTFLLESVELVYFYDFSFKLKSGTITTKCTTRKYETNFLLAYCQGSNIYLWLKQ